MGVLSGFELHWWGAKKREARGSEGYSSAARKRIQKKHNVKKRRKKVPDISGKFAALGAGLRRGKPHGAVISLAHTLHSLKTRLKEVC